MKGRYIWISIPLALALLLLLNLTVRIPVGSYQKITEVELPYYRAKISSKGSGTSVVVLNLPEGNYTVISGEGEALPSYYNGTHLLVRAPLALGVNSLLIFHSPSNYDAHDIFDFFDDFSSGNLGSKWRTLIDEESVRPSEGYLEISGGERWDKVESHYLEMKPPYIVETNLSCQADFCWICLTGNDVQLKDELGWDIPEGICAGMSTLPPSNPWGGIGIKVIGKKGGIGQVLRHENAAGVAPIGTGRYVRMTIVADQDVITLSCCGDTVTMQGYEAPNRFKLKLLVARNGTLTLDWIRVYRYINHDVQIEKSKGVLSLESVENEIRVLEVTDIPGVVELNISCEGYGEQSLPPKKGEAVSFPLEEGVHECLTYFASGNKSLGAVKRVKLVIPSLIDKLLPTIVASASVLVASLGYLLYLKLSRYRQSKELEKILE